MSSSKPKRPLQSFEKDRVVEQAISFSLVR